jgi:hypothetical protein
LARALERGLTVRIPGLLVPMAQETSDKSFGRHRTYSQNRMCHREEAGAVFDVEHRGAKKRGHARTRK